MSVDLLACRVCGAALAPEAVDGRAFRCGGCGAALRLLAFPAAFRDDRSGRAGRPVAEAGQATCYQHGAFQAETACDRCGRYMCGLCDITNLGGHLCPNCIGNMASDPDNHRLRTSYPRFDRLVLGLAVLPILVYFITFITAPIALGLGIFGWNKAYNPVRRYRAALLGGMLVAAAEIGLWMLLIGGLIASTF